MVSPNRSCAWISFQLSMRGWFDAFRHDGGPTLYSVSNRTPVLWDTSVLVICIVVVTLFSAFLLIFPGVRKERFTTFTSVSLSLFTGAVLLLGLCGSSWHVAENSITSSYRSFSNEKVMAIMNVQIGLDHVNITLRSYENETNSEKINFNERFHWIKPDQLAEEYQRALKKGLPYPILTTAEYLSVDEEGFTWGRNYRQAGYFTCIMLWSGFASWCLMNILLIVVPRYGAYGMVFTGVQMVVANLVYYVLLPKFDLVIHIEGSTLNFYLGWCFWLNFSAGIICFTIGFVISVLDLMYPHSFSTILEVNYDTPYDRHIIIEESHDIRKRKSRARLEEGEGATFGSRVLKRFSRRGQTNELYGIDNPACDVNPPKSPWNHAHRQMALQNQFSSGHSLKSTKSVNFQEEIREHPKLEAKNSNTIIWKASPPPRPELDDIETQLVKQDSHTQTISRGVSPLRESTEFAKNSSTISVSSSFLDEDSENTITTNPNGVVIRLGGDSFRSMKRQNSNLSEESAKSDTSLGFSIFNKMSTEEPQEGIHMKRIASVRRSGVRSRKQSGEAVDAEQGVSSTVASKVSAFIGAITVRRPSREEDSEEEGPWS
ncbi:uncharacterized protein LOC136030681 isoform X1 [Artemia franciscana]|uniref:uncharacterized protein LOC136030681 isoform X1 n=1 Tax=Artemia franciscana TaxID=6661 RepID=UPI0032DA6360